MRPPFIAGDRARRRPGQCVRRPRGGERLGRVTLRVPGEHNVLNALAALAALAHAGVGFDEAAPQLAGFSGAARRYQEVGRHDGVVVIDDYAHHPTEVAATLKAARSGSYRRVIAVFQPHLFSRTRYLQREFGRALTMADEAIVTDIFPAREEPEPGVTGKLVVDAYLLERPGGPVFYLPRLGDAVRHLRARVRPGDLVLTIGAGDVLHVGERLLAALRDEAAPGDAVRRMNRVGLAAAACSRPSPGGLIVAVPLGVYAWGRSSGTFRVDRIVVSGARPAHAKAVRLVLRRRFLGANLFTVTAARVRATLAGFPYVDQVEVDRDFPDTLKVRVTEFVPAALLRSDDRWYVVSTEGRVLAEATTTAAPGSARRRRPPRSSPAPGSAGAGRLAGGERVAGRRSRDGCRVALTAPGRVHRRVAFADASSTSLPQPAADVGLPRGTVSAGDRVDTPVTVGENRRRP